MTTLKEKTARGLMWGGMSNIIQQLLGVAFGIVLGRLLDPSDYGMIAMITIFSLIANEIQNSGFKPALTNLKSPSHDDFNSVFWFNITASLTLYAILFLCAPAIAAFYRKPELVPLCRYAFLGFVFASLGAAQNAYLFKHLMAREVGKAGIIAILVSNITGVTMAFMGYRYWALATQSILYIAVNSLLFWLYSPWRPTLKVTFKPLKGMFRFSVKVMLTAIVNIVSNNILNVLLGRLYSIAQTGYYNQAYQWNHKASFSLQGMVLQVAQPVLVEVSDEKERELRVLRKMVRFTAFVAFPLLLGLALVSKEFIVVTITEKWLPSARLLQMMCLAGAAMPLCILLNNCVLSRGKSGQFMWASVALCAAQLLTLFLTHTFNPNPGNITPLVAGFVTVNILWLFVWQQLVKRLTGYRLRQFLADILPFLLITVAVMVATWFATCAITTPWLLLTTRVVLAAALYYAVMRLLRVVIFEESMQFVKSLFHRRKQP